MDVRTRRVFPRIRTESCRGEEDLEKERKEEEKELPFEVAALRQDHLQWKDPILARHNSMEIMAAQESAIDRTQYLVIRDPPTEGPDTRLRRVRDFSFRLDFWFQTVISDFRPWFLISTKISDFRPWFPISTKISDFRPWFPISDRDFRVPVYERRYAILLFVLLRHSWIAVLSPLICGRQRPAGFSLAMKLRKEKYLW